MWEESQNTFVDRKVGSSVVAAVRTLGIDFEFQNAESIGHRLGPRNQLGPHNQLGDSSFGL